MIKRFLSYVEITTKITSVFAFFSTIAFILYRGHKIEWLPTSVFFCSMFIFDLATTAINNYIDTKTNDQILQFERRKAFIIILLLLVISSFLGIYLVYLTDIVVLLLGGLCFLCGIFYTFGPVPISRQPLGEILSGIFYGFFIPLILMYINMPHGSLLTFTLELKTISLELKVVPVISLILFSIAPVCTTANIMLANNICDVEKDIAVKRYTLPYYLGIKSSLYLFAGLYYLTYLAVITMVIFKILSPVCLLFLFTIFVVQKNISIFQKEQRKDKTFISSIKNYIIIMGTYTALIFIGVLVSWLVGIV